MPAALIAALTTVDGATDNISTLLLIVYVVCFCEIQSWTVNDQLLNLVCQISATSDILNFAPCIQVYEFGLFSLSNLKLHSLNL